MGRFTAYDQNGRMVADFDKSEYDFLRRFGRTPEEVLAENAKLREELDAVGMAAYLYGKEQLESENAKLRELVADMWLHDYARHWSTLDSDMEHRESVWQRMCELGIEVPL